MIHLFRLNSGDVAKICIRHYHYQSINEPLSENAPERKQVEQPSTNSSSHKHKCFTSCMKEWYQPPIDSQCGLILLKLSGIEHVTKKVFNVKGVFLNNKKKQVVVCARAKDIDSFY